ncbi:conjugal transfer protein TrbL [Georgenia sp. AZ-5]|uniref:conjugal transfer protein TrbL n=1 Tax=Georgenia sp. AZ-5 TaxID=3367526 RepID=UPI003754081D
MAVSVCEIPGIAAVCAKVGESVATALLVPFQVLADLTTSAAAWMVRTMWAAFETTTFVDITTGQFTRVYSIVFGVAVFIMVTFFLLQVITAMIRREPAALSRAALGLAKSVLGSFVVLTLVATALEITDQLCLGIIQATGTTLDQMGERISLPTAALTYAGAAGGPALPIIVVFLLACLAIGASFIVWLSLLIRKALLLIAIVFAPFALAGASWDATRGWVSRWASFVLALISSELVVVVIFLLATAQVSAPISPDLQSFADPMAGVVLMLVAGFAPYLTYKAISFIGFDMYHAVGAEQEAKQAVNRPIPIPTRALPRASAPAVLGGPPGTPGTQGQPGQPGTGGPGTAPTAVRTGGAPAPSTAGSATASSGAPAAGSSAAGGSAAGGAAVAGGAAATGALLAGAVAVEATKVGPRVGRAIAGQAAQHDTAARGAQP